LGDVFHTMTPKRTPRPYRGKYPTRINTVYSVGRQTRVQLNNGERYTIRPTSPEGRHRMPQANIEISEFAAPHYLATRI
jgi:hypothetical protein